MKWNGSIYYNVISQDNLGVDRAALMQAACPVPPSSLPGAPGTAEQQIEPARLWHNISSTCSFYFSSSQGQTSKNLKKKKKDWREIEMADHKFSKMTTYSTKPRAGEVSVQCQHGGSFAE